MGNKIIEIDSATGTPARLHGPTAGRAYVTAGEAISVAGRERHLLQVIIIKNNKVVANWWETSGTGGLLGHTEQKAFGRIRLDQIRGYDIEFRGQFSACTKKGGCFNTIDYVSRKYGVNITYRASDRPWNAFFAADEGHIPNFFENNLGTKPIEINKSKRRLNTLTINTSANNDSDVSPESKEVIKKQIEERKAGRKERKANLGQKDAGNKMTSNHGLKNPKGTQKLQPTVPSERIHNASRGTVIRSFLSEIDFNKIKYNVGFSFKVGKNIAKNIGPGLAAEFAIGMLTDYLLAKTFHWLFEDAAAKDGRKKLIALSQKVVPDIEKNIEVAIKSYISDLEYKAYHKDYKAAVNYRLILSWYPGNHYIPEKLLIDSVSIVPNGKYLNVKCEPKKLKGNISREEGRYLISDPEMYKLLSCTRYLSIDMPNPGKPSLEGTWNLFWQKQRQYLGEIHIKMSQKDIISQFNAIGISGKPLEIYNIRWNRPLLKFRIRTYFEDLKGYQEYHLRFKKWDILVGTEFNYPISNYEFDFFNYEYDSAFEVILERSSNFNVLKDSRERYPSFDATKQ